MRCRRRIAGGWVLPLLVGLVGCTALRVERPTVVQPADWLTEGDSPRRTHAADVTLTPPLAEAWTYKAGGGFGPGSPLVLGEAVLVATRHGEVHAVRLADGKKIGTQGFGEAVEGTPVIGHGLLYVPVAWGGKVLRAFDLDRTRDVWVRREQPPIVAGLLLLDQTLFAVDVESTVWALDARTGEPRWTRRLNERATVYATPVATAAGDVVVADDAGVVTALASGDGAVRWQHALGAPVEVTPTIDGTTLYVSTTRGRLVALHAADGTERWRYAVPDTTVRLAAPALDGGDLVFGGSDGIVRLIDAATGTVRWTFTAPDAITAPPLLTREMVFVGTMGRMLYALDRATGAARWSHRLKGRIKSAMAARDGVLLVLTEPNLVYAFVPEKAALATTD